MKITAKKKHKRGTYQSYITTLGQMLELALKGLIVCDEEQRKMKTNKSYKEHRLAFISSLLIAAFSDSSDFSEQSKKALTTYVGAPLTMILSEIQLVGIKVINGKLFLSDGQHRLLGYLLDFIKGAFCIKCTDDLKNDYLIRKMAEIFKWNVILEDGDTIKVITWDMLPDEIKDYILNIPVVAQCIEPLDKEEGNAFFTSLNSSIAVSNNELDNAKYCHYTMYKVIKEFHEALTSTTVGQQLSLFIGDNHKTFSEKETRALKLLVPKNIKTALPMIAHAGLIVLLPRNMVKNYQWERNNSNQSDHVRNFMKATEKMSKSQCEKYIRSLISNLLKIAKNMYEYNFSGMSSCGGWPSLTVGQMYAMHTTTIPKEAFKEIAITLTHSICEGNYLHNEEGLNSKFCVEKGYSSFFNNGHQQRSKNERFSDLCDDIYARELRRAKEMECAA